MRWYYWRVKSLVLPEIEANVPAFSRNKHEIKA
jgi:hypothetical protein